MSLFNDNLKNIKVKNLAIFIIVSYIILYVISQFNNVISPEWIYVAVIGYFIFELKDFTKDFRGELGSVFSKIGFKDVLAAVFANIFFSYGMLYLANSLAVNFPALDFLVNFSLPSMSLIGFSSLISTVVISPVAEELIFRGVVLNRLKIYVPTVFAVLISSLLFGSLHNFGSIISAVVFAVCMAILYLKTENICVPILAHFLNNLFAEIIRYADVNELLFTDTRVMAVMSLFAVMSAVILSVAIAKELNRIK